MEWESWPRVRTCTLLIILGFTSHFPGVFAQTNSGETKPESQKVERDGQHDFDWAVGSWKIHLKRLAKALAGSTNWAEFDGTVVCRKVLDGRAEVEEFTVDGLDKPGHIEGLALRLYDPKAHQWSIYWINAADGTLGLPPVVGQFSNGRGEFYDQEEHDGRAIFARYVWTKVTTNSPHFEQSFSTDGGKTWETNWITDQIREKP